MSKVSLTGAQIAIMDWIKLIITETEKRIDNNEPAEDIKRTLSRISPWLPHLILNEKTPTPASQGQSPFTQPATITWETTPPYHYVLSKTSETEFRKATGLLPQEWTDFTVYMKSLY
jgi:hypothetical protein